MTTMGKSYGKGKKVISKPEQRDGMHVMYSSVFEFAGATDLVLTKARFVCSAHDKNHLGGIPFFPVRLLVAVRNIVGGLRPKRWATNQYHSLFRLLTQGSLSSSSAVHYTLLDEQISTLYA